MAYQILNNESPSDNSDESECSETDLFYKENKYLFDSQIIKGPSSEEEFHAVGFRYSFLYSFLFHSLGLLSLGSLYLIVYWKPHWEIILKRRKSCLSDADRIILKDLDGLRHAVCVEYTEVEELPDTSKEWVTETLDGKRFIRYFIFKYLKYVWNSRRYRFQCLPGLDPKITVASILKDFKGFSESERIIREKIYGSNSITVEVQSYGKLLFTEVLNPFYIFQIASLILWCSDEYYYYAFCIFIISCMSIGVSLYETRRQSQSLKEMVECSKAHTMNVIRNINDPHSVEVDATSIVPGDVIVIPSSGALMACDAVLIRGTAIVNESMLTGESVPVTKVPFSASEESEIYSPENHKRHTLFSGTKVIQTRYYGKEQVLAVVVRTGFNTAKGELVRSILYPRPIDFKFYRDSMKFIGLLFFVALIGMSYSIYTYVRQNRPILTTIIRALDIITIVVPPALPAAMTVGTYYAQNRLKKMGIFCISPPRINICGKIKLFCFDKTGTLTEDGLEVWGVVNVQSSSKDENKFDIPTTDVHHLPPTRLLTVALASCHSLTYINGELTGDPLDICMFEATKWELVETQTDAENFDSLIPSIVRPPTKHLYVAKNEEECNLVGHVAVCIPAPQEESESQRDQSETRISNASFVPNNILVDINEDGEENANLEANQDTESLDSSGMVEQVPYEIGLVRQFPFSSSVQRMSVVAKVLGKPGMEVFCKGAPEVVCQLCDPNTIPKNYNALMTKYTNEGYRVLAFAHKYLPPKFTWYSVQRAKRDKMECDMSFVGLLILQNVLKSETTPVIQELREANIRTVMVTGDNIQTAVCVARDCGMVYEGEDVYMIKVSPDSDGKYSFMLENTQGVSSKEELQSLQTLIMESENLHRLIIEPESNIHLAVTGTAWSNLKSHFPHLVPYVVSSGTIFGRMTPDQKVQLVEELMALGYVVGMCGDGANDCGALKAAHVGISLSEAEASVAAPFTSRLQHIGCVPRVICEGRAALTTNFSVFKYMTLYSIIQFVSVLILYTVCTNLSDAQFLYIDLFVVTSLAVFMGYTGAEHKLVAKRPLTSLVGPLNMFSVVFQMALVIATQGFVFGYLQLQPWYFFPEDRCQPTETDQEVFTWDTNAIFCVSSFQYVCLAIIFSPGRPFRKPLYTNVLLLLAIISLTSVSLWLLLYPPPVLVSFMELRPFPDDFAWQFRGTLLLIAGLHFVLGWSIEYFVSRGRSLKNCIRCCYPKTEPKNIYKRVQCRMTEDPTWPPIESPIYSESSSVIQDQL